MAEKVTFLVSAKQEAKRKIQLIKDQISIMIVHLQEIANDPISEKFDGEPMECAVQALESALDDLEELK